MSQQVDQDVLETLLLPLDRQLLTWPRSRALFMRARMGAPLLGVDRAQLRCEQTFKPDAAALTHAGFDVVAASSPSDRYALILLLTPRQRDESRASMARAVSLLAPGGRILACASNNAGARSAQDDLEKLAGRLQVLTKNKCRVFWSEPLQGPIDTALAAQWRALDAERPILDGRFVSRPGVFAWDRIDIASALLARHLPQDLAGHAADLGAGFGYLAAELLTRCVQIASVDVYEAEARALDLARFNLAPLGQRAHITYHWHDVTAGLSQRYEVIVSNPPFHAGVGTERPDIGRRFIAVAAEALRPGGQLWLVANRHLPYETVLNASFGRVRIVAQEQGFKIIEAVRAESRR